MPINEETLMNKLDAGESLQGVEIARVIFDSHSHEKFLNFAGAVFVEGARFTQTKFKGGASFKGVIFEQEAVFSMTEFSNEMNVDFSNAKAENITFAGATLVGVNFNDAELGADFKNADLSNATFKNATLIKANFAGAKTSGTNFSGANVANAKLPTELNNFAEGLRAVEETSKIARKLFGWLLAAVAFCGLTIASTNDLALLTNSPTSPLPLIQTPIPLAGFYWFTPFFLLAFFVYFQLQLQHNWRLIADLPAVFPDGKTADKKVFPWLLNTWACQFFEKLSAGHHVSRMHNVLVVCLVWVLTPAMLAAFWFRYLSRHEAWGTGFHILFLTVAAGATWYFLYKAKENFRISNSTAPGPKGILLFLLIATLPISGMVLWGNLDVVPLKLRSTVTASFSNQEVTRKLKDWDYKNPLKRIKRADLAGANLRYGDLSNAFLVNANLMRADLTGADLRGAKLQKAKLIRWANLRGADLTKAELMGANLAEADLTIANLEDADLTEAELWKVTLTRTSLGGANLRGANLKGAKNLNCKQLELAKINRHTGLPSYITIKWNNDGTHVCKQE